MSAVLRPAIILLLTMTVLTGIVYPFTVTAVAQLVFPSQAGGSVLVSNGRAVGSELIGQSFTDAKYFWSRPSATTPQPYNAAASGGSNQGPLNPALIDAVKSRIETLKAADPTNALPIPVDLVTTSASGLDPDISIAAARYQAARIARTRSLDLTAVRSLIDAHARGRLLGIIGEPRVNVLELNLALDALKPHDAPPGA